MASPFRDLQQIWNERVKAARLRYEEAHARASGELKAWTAGEVPFPDGGFGLRQATRAETEAIHEYMRVLRIFNELVVHGKRPPED